MGTNDIDDMHQYTTTLDTILKYIKDIEMESSKHPLSGLQKKEYVIKRIQHMPIYQQHSLLIDAMIDSLILVSNHPNILKADNICSNTFFLCCGC